MASPSSAAGMSQMASMPTPTASSTASTAAASNNTNTTNTTNNTTTTSARAFTPTTHKPPRHRGTKACRRCRRLRNKCIHDHGQTPCQGCAAAGPETAASCAFPLRGERDVDREFRRRPRPAAPPHQQEQRTSVHPPVVHPSRLPPPGHLEGWPPHDEVVDGCRVFVTCYFQLGFLPRSLFIERLVQAPDESNKFLLSCLLAISSRFTPSLVQRYGSRTAATDHFLGLAQSQALVEMYAPSLERTQAFFLLSIAEWGNSDRDRSAIDMAVALRMALLLRLHKEETYAASTPNNTSSPAAVGNTPTPRAAGVTPRANGASAGAIAAAPPTPHITTASATPRSVTAPSPAASLGTSSATADHVVRLESARRTLWMIYSQENLHSGTSTPAPLSLEDTTALLPCDEADFSFGAVPAVRAALEGTPPARDDPSLAIHPERCLFATLIQAHSLWGRVARHATRDALWGGARGSAYIQITESLRRWEATLPTRHRWSLWNLRGWRSEGLHLAYLSVVMVLRLSNIVIRRVFLDEMITTLQSPGSPQVTAVELATWQRVSYDLFDNVVELHEQVTAYFSMRTPDEGFPAILVFCVYMCGSLASYLWHNPSLCPHVSPVEAEEMALGTLRILSELYTAWPASARWEEVLRRVAVREGEPATDGINGETSTSTGMIIDLPERSRTDAPMLNDLQPASASASASASARSSRSSTASEDDLRLLITDFPSDLFNAELADYLNGTIHYGLLDGLY
ncbi:hypothetical protein SBRCBS47491_004579 [Sporothrix bragantina]|uniref:Xylanolytic transcriptional activator regulatory domain-containing protein n=1 Tax=Sporothrix bragantina TaxID=671064 RepID=A0ABP0BQ05_9PEZI